MKKILTFLFLMTSVISFSQNDVFAINTIKEKKIINPYENKIDLKLIKYKSETNDKTYGLVLLLGGLAFTAASIIEGDGNYGTWSHNQNSTSQYNMTYKTKPFIEQTPRQIMLFVGLGLTITGGVLSIR